MILHVLHEGQTQFLLRLHANNKSRKTYAYNIYSTLTFLQTPFSKLHSTIEVYQVIIKPSWREDLLHIYDVSFSLCIFPYSTEMYHTVEET